MNFNIQEKTVFLTLSGSHAYGMATGSSDYDYRGIAIPPIENYIGILDKFEQIVDQGNKSPHVYKNFPIGLLKHDPRCENADPDLAPDMQIMEISKFVRLALANNPSVIELLFSDPQDHVIYNPIIKPLFDNKEKILSKQTKARFCGYALSQLKRLKSHKKWIENPPEKMPTRQDFGLPELTGKLNQFKLGEADALINQEVQNFMIDQTHLPDDVKIELSFSMKKSMRIIWEALNQSSDYPVGEGKTFEHTKDALYNKVAKDQGFSDEFIDLLNREKNYRNAKKIWDQYQVWLKDRNLKRSEIEKKIGFDGKHASHLVRLMRMAREIIQYGQVNVKRPDAKELLSIREGAWSYEQLIDFAEKENDNLESLVKTSKLPKTPDFHFFDKLVRNIICDFNKGSI